MREPCMEHHPFGIALYRPPSSSIVRPGIIGYFDEFGSWNTISDLADHEDFQQKGLRLPEELVKAPTDSGINWGPKTSSSTKATKKRKRRLIFQLEPSTRNSSDSLTTASAVYSYQIDEDVGAILLTSAPISHERYYHTTPFKKWMKQNASVILDRWRDEAKENGIWIVTSTFSAKKCAINMWTKKGRGFKVGFSADVMSIANAGPSIDWYRSHTDEGWGEYAADEDSRCVVFFGGLKFRFSQGFRKLLSLKNHYLRVPKSGEQEGEDTEEEAEYIVTVPDPDNEDQEFEVDYQDYGKAQAMPDQDSDLPAQIKTRLNVLTCACGEANFRLI